MNDQFRKLIWKDGILKFPCGVKVEITEEKIRRLFTMFKLKDEIEHMITTGRYSEIPKGAAYQIKSHLTD